MKRHDSVDAYIADAEPWQDELVRLREILQATELEETVKWGAPAYTCDGKVLVGIGSFRSFFALWFFQGALLEDKAGVLINAQEGRTKALRQWRFTAKKDIKVRLIKAYVKEAIELQRQGKAIQPARNKPVVVPPQLQAALRKNTSAAAAFQELSQGKRREYADYIADAKREDTKSKRLDKILPMIEEGVGLNDRYR